MEGGTATPFDVGAGDMTSTTFPGILAVFQRPLLLSVASLLELMRNFPGAEGSLGHQGVESCATCS